MIALRRRSSKSRDRILKLISINKTRDLINYSRKWEFKMRSKKIRSSCRESLSISGP